MRKLQTRVAADVSRYTENFFFGMSGRQTALAAAGVAATAGAYALLHFPGIAAIACGFPFFVSAFYSPYGLTLRTYAICLAETNFVRPKERIFEREDPLYLLLWHGKRDGRTVLTEKELMALRSEGKRVHLTGKRKRR